jgi:hypothetical protein
MEAPEIAMERGALPARLTVLADRLDCLTEEDLLLLADVTPTTADAWRKRGEGPAYIRAGKRFLYPRAAVAEWLEGRVRERRVLPAKGLL